MHTDQEVTRIIRSWLRTDEHESADQILDDVLALLGATPQHRSWWPARRIAHVNPLAKLAAAAVSVVVVALIGITLFPFRGATTGPGGPSATAPSLSPSIPPISLLADSAGRYRLMVDRTTLTVAFPAGWRTGLVGDGGGAVIDKMVTGGEASIFIWNPDNVYVDPCLHTKLSPPPGLTADAFAAAVAKMGSIQKTEPPAAAQVGKQPAKHLVITIPTRASCAAGDGGFQLWYNQGSDDGCPGDVECARFATQLGDVVSLWLVDGPGGRVIVEGETPAAATPTERQEIQTIVDSIQF